MRAWEETQHARFGMLPSGHISQFTRHARLPSVHGVWSAWESQQFALFFRSQLQAIAVESLISFSQVYFSFIKLNGKV
jgi:hypothetical protein